MNSNKKLLKFIDSQIKILKREKCDLDNGFDYDDILEHVNCSILAARKEGAIGALTEMRRFIEDINFKENRCEGCIGSNPPPKSAKPGFERKMHYEK